MNQAPTSAHHHLSWLTASRLLGLRASVSPGTCNRQGRDCSKMSFLLPTSSSVVCTHTPTPMWLSQTLWVQIPSHGTRGSPETRLHLPLPWEEPGGPAFSLRTGQASSLELLVTRSWPLAGGWLSSLCSDAAELPVIVEKPVVGSNTATAEVSAVVSAITGEGCRAKSESSSPGIWQLTCAPSSPTTTGSEQPTSEGSSFGPPHCLHEEAAQQNRPCCPASRS